MSSVLHGKMKIIIFILWSIYFWTATYSREVILLDTRLNSDELQWHKYTNLVSRHEDTPVGWQEESFTAQNRKNINWRSYVVCELGAKNAENWLRLPYMRRGSANRIYIEMGFTIRDCQKFPSKAVTCKETFSLFSYEADSDFATESMPRWDDYRLIGRVTSREGRITDIKGTVPPNVETRSIPLTKKGVYFAIRDQGACTSLLYFKIYYKVCEEVLHEFAMFPETPTGKGSIEIVQQSGRCIKHASLIGSEKPMLLCKADGTWDSLPGKCECDPGYSPKDGKCQACGPDHFKALSGGEGCVRCPENSESKDKATTECPCLDGYYRADSDGHGDPCTKPPSQPVDLTVVSLSHDSAVITWSHPRELGGRTDLFYTVQCPSCPRAVEFLPKKSGFNDTMLTLTGLHPTSVYSVRIVAENGVSSQKPKTQRKSATTVQFETPKIETYQVRNLQAQLLNEASEVRVDWAPPLLPRTSSQSVIRRLSTNSAISQELEEPEIAPVSKYLVRIYEKTDGGSNSSEKVLTTPPLRMHTLEHGITYGFQVKAFVDDIGWGGWSHVAWSSPVSAKSDQDEGSKGESPGSNDLIWIGIILVVIFISSCIAIIGYLVQRNRFTRASSRNQSSTEDIVYKSMPSSMVGSTPPLYSGVKPYVDPLTYEDLGQAIQEFTTEIPVEAVTIEEVIGAGEFGEVCRGKVRVGNYESTVAIKTLKRGSGDGAKKNFLTEASVMGQFFHPNITSLKGVVSKTEPVMILIEYMQNGSLDSFLKCRDNQLSVGQLISMLRCVACGMNYLADIGYVHRDLAARNVLVDGNLICKIADFGLSRVTEEISSCENAYTTSGGKIPVRWTSPEAIAYRKFTTGSDVWSFGVVLWEVMSFGERPYWDWTNQDVIEAVDRGFRLPCPMDCPKPLHDMMLNCWESDRSRRPTFSDLLQTLDSFLMHPQLLGSSCNSRYGACRDCPQSPCSNLDSCSSTACHSCQSLARSSSFRPQRPLTKKSAYSSGSLRANKNSIDRFLDQLHLSMYSSVLQSAGVTSLAQLANFSTGELERIGIRSREHQQTLFDAIQHYHSVPVTPPVLAANRRANLMRASGQMMTGTCCSIPIGADEYSTSASLGSGTTERAKTVPHGELTVLPSASKADVNRLPRRKSSKEYCVNSSTAPTAGQFQSQESSVNTYGDPNSVTGFYV